MMIKKLLLTICLILLFPILSFAGSVDLGWDANTESDLAGYKIYKGESSGNYGEVFDVGNVITYRMSNLVAGIIFYFAAVAYDTEGLESGYSNEVVYYPLDVMNLTGEVVDDSSPDTVNNLRGE